MFEERSKIAFGSILNIAEKAESVTSDTVCVCT